ncbi:outer membrane protein [Paracoccus sp. (in: a-proteobacteria)]|uniref:outer membrane protein n=1 Tax=Paracoccus sp. TaxID=267 RepID=UPI0026DFC36F|nr:outer membrane beta-barrel protein [Paracoccus sp. (in: a-proteobacteria)]MDO5647106.1 outer membrane beta-barrel protein [Paracoccus sp. (in: a-proteobacteria)]
MSRFTSLLGSVVAAGIALSGAAMAGEPVIIPVIAPVVEPVPTVVPPKEDNWAGAYAGWMIARACCGEDRVGFHTNPNEIYEGDVSTLRIAGPLMGVRLGYRWQRDEWVFGPELGYERLRVKDAVTYTGFFDNNVTGMRRIEGSGSNDLKSLTALRFKTGRLLNPETLVYGIAGYGSAKMDYSADLTRRLSEGAEVAHSATYRNFNMSGYILGLGIERKLSKNFTGSFEYEYVNLGRKRLPVNEVHTVATPKYHAVKLGVNYRF